MLSRQLAGEKVGVCVSGGLSSLTVAAWLAASSVPVTAFVADLGQGTGDDVRALARALQAAGVAAVVTDLRDEIAQLAFDLVRYQAQYDGGYWNTTSGSRLVLVAGLAEAMRRAGCTVLAHGCVGGGNDQRRFERYVAALAPDLRALSPWTDPDLLSRFPGRADMTRYLRDRGLAADQRSTADYSADGSLAGFAHDGTALECLQTPDDAAWRALTVAPRQAPDDPEAVPVAIAGGRPVRVGNAPGTARELLGHANAVAGRHGVGLRSVVENRVNGTKCRGVYESPGLDLLGFCVARVYQVAMDPEALRLMHGLSGQIGRGVYEGRYLDPAIRAARAAADVLIESAGATAEVTAELYKGAISFQGLTHDADERVAPRQTRFTGGGQHWQIVA
ncbi:MAG TPA: argininosuccinate synthase domain-containing protein [Streptosporangiaceae bacterium]|jgi:argininosuccinate synthase